MAKPAAAEVGTVYYFQPVVARGVTVFPCGGPLLEVEGKTATLGIPGAALRPKAAGKKVEIMCVTGESRTPFRGWIVRQRADTVTIAFDPLVGSNALGVIEERTLPPSWRGVSPDQVASIRQPTWWRLLPDSSNCNLESTLRKKNTYSKEEDDRILKMGRGVTQKFHWSYISCELGRFRPDLEPGAQQTTGRFRFTLNEGNPVEREAKRIPGGVDVSLTLRTVHKLMKEGREPLTLRNIYKEISATIPEDQLNRDAAVGQSGKILVWQLAVKRHLANKTLFCSAKETKKRATYALTEAGRKRIEGPVEPPMKRRKTSSSKNKKHLDFVKAFRK